jgi:hypothetical protein
MGLLAAYPDLTEPKGRAHPAYCLSLSPSLLNPDFGIDVLKSRKSWDFYIRDYYFQDYFVREKFVAPNFQNNKKNLKRVNIEFVKNP